MLELILSTVREDERIRAAVMNGSRADPAARRDPFQDFDVVFIVTELDSFKSDPSWIDRFGERMILQLPDDMQDPPPEVHDGYIYLMQFTDGNRIDLYLHPVACLTTLASDSLTVPLLDKDGILPAFPPPDESDYLPQPPTAKQFADCCNEFWWVSALVAKGLWREQLVYSMLMLEKMREQLVKMIVWYVGVKTEFQKNTGSFGTYIDRHLEPGLWSQLHQTWCSPEPGQVWDALTASGRLFRHCAMAVADKFAFAYPHEDDRRVSAHLRHVRRLPGDAREIY